MTADTFQRRLKLAGIFTSAGLLLQVATLYGSHPLTFIAFVAAGGTLVGMGVLLYLYALVSR